MSRVFVREATGLVREISGTSLLVFGATNINYLAITAYDFTLFPLLGGTFSLLFGVLVSMVIMIATTTVFWSMGTITPRSGGDYVFVSRTLYPLLGFIENFLGAIIQVLWAGITMATLAPLTFTPILTFYGALTNNKSLIGSGALFSDPTVTAVVAILFGLISAVPALFALKHYLRFQNVVFVLILVPCLIIFGSFAVLSQAGFASTYNGFVGRYAGTAGDYYSNVITSAKEAGFTLPADSWWGGLLIVPLICNNIGGWLNAPVQVAGEVRHVRRSLLVAMIGGIALYTVVCTVIVLVTYNTVGLQWAGSLNYLLYNASDKLVIPAGLVYINFLGMIASSNSVLALVIVVAGFLAMFMFMSNAYIWISRCLFAYSFDRVLPTWFAKVSDRTHAPINAIITALIMAFAFFVVASIPQSAPYAFLFGSVGIVLFAIISIIVSLSTLLLPKLNPAFYKFSPMKGPALYVASAVSIIGWLLVGYLILTIPTYGATTPLAYATVAGVIVILCLVFGAARLRRGPDFGLAFKEIPPE